MTDLRQRYHRILKAKGINPATVSQAADALVDAIDECLRVELAQVASNWQSHLRLKKQVDAMKATAEE